MNRTVVLSLIILVSIIAPAAMGDDEKPLIFELFEGDWRSDRPAFGSLALSTMNWAPALNGKHVRLDYLIEMRGPEGAHSSFKGIAFYRIARGDRFDGFWADNSGDLHSISAERDGDALIADWGVAGGKQGRTRYELTAPDKIEVTDWIRTEDGWQQFNQNTFERTDAAN